MSDGDIVEQQQAQESMETSEAGGNAAAAAAPKADEDDRKLFAGGLPQEAKEEDIKEYFCQFGEIDNINLKTDQHTGRSRGFCFVVFKEVDAVNKAVENKEHNMKGKKVAVKKAQAKQGKIYVGKLKPEITDDDVREFFAQYGSIANIEQPFDKVKNERKNFCFITFDREEPAKKLLKQESVTIKGIELDINKVTPKQQPPMFAGAGGAGRGGGPAPWGAYGGGGQWGGYGGYGGGDFYGGYGGGYDQYGGGYGGGGWGGQYGGGQGGWGQPGGGAGFGGKTPRGRGMPRGGAARGQRQKPY